MNPDHYLRSFRILDLFTGRQEGMRLSEIRAATGLPASSVHNMLQTMVAAQVLTVSEDLRYGLDPRMIGRAQATVNSLRLRTMARPLLTQLARDIGHDVYLAMRLGRRVFYADRCHGGHKVSLDVQIGVPLYLHSTATGKLFAAHDAELLEQLLRRPLPRLTERTLVGRGARCRVPRHTRQGLVGRPGGNGAGHRRVGRAAVVGARGAAAVLRDGRRAARVRHRLGGPPAGGPGDRCRPGLCRTH